MTSMSNHNQEQKTAMNNWNVNGEPQLQSGVNPWGHEVPRYEYKTSDAMGLAPRDEVLEKMLFHHERPAKGINFGKYDDIQVHLEVTSDNSFEPIKTFAQANLHPAMRDNIRLCDYQEPTPVQAYSIPCLLAGHDLLAGAQTGMLANRVTESDDFLMI